MMKKGRKRMHDAARGLMLVLMGLMTCLTVGAQKKHKPVDNVEVRPVFRVQLSENDAKRFNYFFLEAVRQQQKENHAAAFDLFKHCLDIDPQAPEVFFALANLYRGMNDRVAMLECMRKAAETAPDNDTYLENLGEAYLGIHDYESAIGIYEKLFANNSDRTDVLSTLIQLYNWRPDYPKVIEALNRMETIEGSSEDITLSKMQVYSILGDKKKEYNELRNLAKQHPYDYNYRVMMGNWLLQNGKKKEALAEYNAVLKKEPNNIMARMSILDYYKSENMDSLAKEQTIQLLLSPSTEADSRMLLMRQFISDSETDEATDSSQVLQLFSKILEMPQPNADMAELQTAYMSLKKMPEETINKALERVLEIEPGNVGARIQLLQNAWGKKDFDRIISLSKPAIEYNPDNIVFYYFQGLAYAQKDDNDNALDTFRKGVGQVNETSNRDLVSDFYNIMGDILHEKGFEEEAYAAYDSCLQWKPNNIPCLNNYAYYLSVKDRELSKAEQMSYRTVKAEPKNSTYLDTYAWILFRQQRFQEAKVYIDQALANDSTAGSVIVEHAGDIYFMAGEEEKAMEFWKKALEMGEEENALLEEKIKKKKYIDDIQK